MAFPAGSAKRNPARHDGNGDAFWGHRQIASISSPNVATILEENDSGGNAPYRLSRINPSAPRRYMRIGGRFGITSGATIGGLVKNAKKTPQRHKAHQVEKPLFYIFFKKVLKKDLERV